MSKLRTDWFNCWTIIRMCHRSDIGCRCCRVGQRYVWSWWEWWCRWRWWLLWNVGFHFYINESHDKDVVERKRSDENSSCLRIVFVFAPNKDEINEAFERLFVDTGGACTGRVSLVWRRCFAKRSLLVKKSAWISSHNFLKRLACPEILRVSCYSRSRIVSITNQ